MEGGGGGWRRRIGTDCADCGEGFAGVAAYYVRHVIWFGVVCLRFRMQGLPSRDLSHLGRDWESTAKLVDLKKECFDLRAMFFSRESRVQVLASREKG